MAFYTTVSADVRERWTERILNLRQNYGLTQEMLARELGVSYRSIQYYEAGTKVPSPLMRRAIERLETRLEHGNNDKRP